MKHKLFSLKELLVFSLISAILFGFSCSFIMYRHYESKTIKYDYSDVTKDKDLSEFLNKYQEIVDNYYTDIDKSQLFDAALSAMLNYLGDPYTSYLDEEQTKNLLETLSGEYVGIGIEVSADDTSSVTISKVFADTPAAKSGIKVGDVISTVNGKSIDATNMSIMTDEIKNGESATSSIVVLRNKLPYTYTVTREKIYIPSVYSEILNNNIGYLKITIFSNTTDEQVATALKDLKSKGVSKLIIDLRDNSGGYLTSAKSIIEQFLKRNQIMYSIQSKEKTDEYKDTTDEYITDKIVILTNGATASASEILTAALVDNNLATTVGVKTYGKGKVQETSETSSGGMIKYTSAKWLTPLGVCIDEVGITPNTVVELSSEYINNPIRSNDNQLAKAIEIINQ